MYVRQIFGGSTPPKYLTDACLSNIWGVYTSKIFDGCMSVKYLGVYTSKMFDGCMSVKYLGGLHPQKKIDGCMSVKYLGGLHPENI